MTADNLVMLLALAASSALAGFLSIADQKGWPRGAMFSQSNVPIAIALGSVLVVAGRILAGITVGKLSWLWLLWTLVAFFLGGPLVLAILRKWSGLITLVAAPALAIASFFVA